MATIASPLARKVTSAQLNHRAAVLTSIANHIQGTTANIRRISASVQHIQKELERIPTTTSSRISWLQSQLNRGL